MEQDKVIKTSDVEKSVWSESEGGGNTNEANKSNYRARWNSARPKKAVVFWYLVATAVLTMIVGFNWGGWVTGGAAQRLGQSMAQDAVVERLSLICVGQFNQDPQKDQKLTELKAVQSYLRDDYVRDQGWATMFGEEKPDNNVASACANLLLQSG